jgi:hypothetical protein
MSLLIDTPRWPWRGRLWAHLVSDDSLDELHTAARALGLRWLSFGRDHYDVPDTLWPAACEMADHVDSRVIVRSLRNSGLRVGGGKPQKAWQPIGALPRDLDTGAVGTWLREVRPAFAHASVDVLARPGELVVLHLLDAGQVPDLGDLAGGPGVGGTRVVHTVADGRYSLELVVDRPARVISNPRAPGRSR